MDNQEFQREVNQDFEERFYHQAMIDHYDRVHGYDD